MLTGIISESRPPCPGIRICGVIHKIYRSEIKAEFRDMGFCRSKNISVSLPSPDKYVCIGDFFFNDFHRDKYWASYRWRFWTDHITRKFIVVRFPKIEIFKFFVFQVAIRSISDVKYFLIAGYRMTPVSRRAFWATPKLKLAPMGRSPQFESLSPLHAPFIRLLT